ncbi:MAG TPA: PIN domain nuclease [Candidatus Saccharimonadales bacterium]|nr:PIN domain nuclease [Candidatus Saccharimonadales bacterium]
MALTARYLVDKSAFARMPLPAVAARLGPLVDSGDLAICGISLLELLFSARSASDLDGIRRDLQLSLAWIPTVDKDLERAADVMALLSRSGGHRSVPIPDLLLAAVAERAGLAVMHYDRDFDAIARVTGQVSEWVAPQGSLP